MIKNYYFGTTHSETLQSVKNLGLNLTRDFESLEEVGVTQQHIEKLNLLTEQAESTGTFKGSIRGQLNKSGVKNRLRKQIIEQIDLINDCLNLSSNSEVAARRTMYIAEVKKAGINEFTQKVSEFVTQLKTQEVDFAKEAQIDRWCTLIKNLVTEYSQTLEQHRSEIMQRYTVTQNRSAAFTELIRYAESLARLACKYWLLQKDPRYRDYQSRNKRSQTTAPVPEAVVQSAAGTPVNAS